MNMSLQERNPFGGRLDADAGTEALYPSEFHFRIITDAQVIDTAVLGSAVAGYKITAPLASSHRSSGGRYLSYSLSVLIESRDELTELDASIKQVPGVRMVL